MTRLKKQKVEYNVHPPPSVFEILGLNVHADATEILVAYQALHRKLNNSKDVKANEKRILLNKAYDVIKDKVSRETYYNVTDRRKYNLK